MAKIRTLRRCALFRNLTFRDLACLAPHIQEETVEPKTWLAEEGKPSEGLIILRTGRVRLIPAQPAGAEVILGPEDFFGELSVIDSGNGVPRRAVGAQAMERCEFLRLNGKHYQQLVSESPDVAGKVALGVLEALHRKMENVRGTMATLFAQGSVR
ncbi:MAG TPA: cyclic nucleotide-binding domain-containing protein [Bdellovibrionota bacterium]|nr:cyclic nucleotide-binding domain-containing protein [Bdellovibrionota bacterium]